MKKIFGLLLLLIIFHPGCKKDDSNPVTNESQVSLAVDSVSGKLANWAYGHLYLAEFGSFGSAVIDENGNFTISEIAIPTDSQLRNFVNYFDSSKTQPAVSDNSAKYFFLSALTMAKVKNPGKALGYIQSNSLATSKNYFYTSYIYFDRPVTINGSTTYNYSFGTHVFSRKENYNNQKFEKGWNKIVFKQSTFDATTNSSNIDIAREEPSNNVWTYSDPVSTVTITGSNALAGLKFPLCIDNGYKKCASLYLASEIYTSGIVTKLSWKALTRKGDLRPIKIYMKEVPADSLSSDYYSKLIEGATQVYDGSVPLLLDSWNWNDFTLLESFPYTGQGNLLIFVETNYGGTGIADDCYFEYSLLNVNHFMTWIGNNSSENKLGALSLNRPNIKITIEQQ